jgi:glutaryl-CoA dehydrogenase
VTPAKPEFKPLDPVDLDGLLTDEERAIRDAVRGWVERRVMPHIAEWFERGTFPKEIYAEVAEMELLGMHLTGNGLPGVGPVAYGLTCMELEAADSGIRSAVSVQGSLCMYPIWRFGSAEQKERWLPPMARGEVIGCFGLSEPDFGSDPSGMRTAAKQDGDEWVLNGTKMWITNGGIADLAIVWARTDDGIRGFLVPTDSPGFTARDIERKLSLRASVTSELILENVRLPADAVLPEAVGMKGPLSTLNEARFGILWGVLGAARSCYETALEYARTREQFGRPIGAFQLTQEKLANMALELGKGQLLALHIGRMKEEGRATPQHVSMGKLNNVREALAIAREARTILGANGITLEYPIIRHMNNLESVLTYEGTSEIHMLILGEALTGLRAFG